MQAAHDDRLDLDPGESSTPSELSSLQVQRMRWTIQHAYDNVDHYRRAFRQAGVTPADLRARSDLAAFPFLTKGDLRDNYPFGMFAVPRSQIRRIHASSGTTGQPTIVGYTEADLATWALVAARSLRAAGVRAGHLLHNAYGYGLFTGGLGVHAGAERLGCTVVPVSGGQTARQVQLICDLQPDAITVTPSYMLAILDEFERQGVDPLTSSLTVGIFGAEPWSEQMRAEVEERAGIHAVDIYGLSEVIGPGVASECVETKDGLHVWEDHFYPEVVDPSSGEPLPDGQYGELVVTSLTKEAMPVIRYRTGDLTRLLPGTARRVRRLERISGRNDDMIILRGVNVFPSQFEQLLLAQPALGAHYQLVRHRTGNLDELRIVTEARQSLTQDERVLLASALRTSVKDALGVSVDCEVVSPGALQRSEGKAQRVLDLREAR